MRKIVVYELLPLDGVAQDPDTFITAWDDTMDANLASGDRDPGRGHPRPAQLRRLGRVLAAGDVDELRLVIAPAIAGTGQRLLDGLPSSTTRVDSHPHDLTDRTPAGGLSRPMNRARGAVHHPGRVTQGAAGKVDG